jgi:predicted HTH transcriptional regulator
MSTIVYGPQLKELVLEALSDSEYVTTRDLMKVLPGRDISNIEGALRVLVSSKSAEFRVEHGRNEWRRV